MKEGSEGRASVRDAGLAAAPEAAPNSGLTLRNRADRRNAPYLRAAQAYMLISMPTGTSTIFGAFQVIRASRGIMARCLCRSEVKATSASAGAPTVNPNFDLRDYRNNRRSALPAPV